MKSLEHLIKSAVRAKRIVVWEYIYLLPYGVLRKNIKDIPFLWLGECGVDTGTQQNDAWEVRLYRPAYDDLLCAPVSRCKTDAILVSVHYVQYLTCHRSFSIYLISR